MRVFFLIPTRPLLLQRSVSQPTHRVDFQPSQPALQVFQTADFQHFPNKFTPLITIQMFSSLQAFILNVSFHLHYSFFACISSRIFPFVLQLPVGIHTCVHTHSVRVYSYIQVCINRYS